MSKPKIVPNELGSMVRAARGEEIARILLDVGAIVINVAQPFTYSSGVKSPIYCDNRLIMSFPAERKVVVRHIIKMLEEEIGPENFDVVAGVATAGIPWASWISDHFDKPMIYVRESSKRHGKEQRIEGHLADGQRVVVVEDLVTTGNSALAAAAAVRDAGGVTPFCAAIFSYESPDALNAFLRERLKIGVLCGVSQLLSYATSVQKISAADRTEVEAWLRSFYASR